MKKIFGLLYLIPAISLANTVTHDITHIDRSTQANTVSSSEENGAGWLNTYANNTDINVMMKVDSNTCWYYTENLNVDLNAHKYEQIRTEENNNLTKCSGKELVVFFCKKGFGARCTFKETEDQNGNIKRTIGEGFLGKVEYLVIPNWLGTSYTRTVTTYDMYGNKVDESPKDERDLTITLEQQYNDPNGDYRVRVRKGQDTLR